MKIITILFFYWLSFVNQPIVPNYRVKYRLTYKPDSTNLKRTASEIFLLFIKENKTSYCASENFLRADSITQLRKKGVLSLGDYMGNANNRFRTYFPQFVQKDYLKQTINLYEDMISVKYTYPLPENLKWDIGMTQEICSGYVCTKATTSYGGRDFIAWFAPEIPIADGPYIFSGLPGLIIKLYDTRNHYVFALEQFEKYESIITEAPTYKSKQPIPTDQAKVIATRLERKKDPLGFITRTTGYSFEHTTITHHGSSQSIPAASALPDRSWDNNPLELK